VSVVFIAIKVCILKFIYKLILICNDLSPFIRGHVRNYFNTLWTGDADLRLYITTVQDG